LLELVKCFSSYWRRFMRHRAAPTLPWFVKLAQSVRQCSETLLQSIKPYLFAAMLVNNNECSSGIQVWHFCSIVGLFTVRTRDRDRLHTVGAAQRTSTSGKQHQTVRTAIGHTAHSSGAIFRAPRAAFRSLHNGDLSEPDLQLLAPQSCHTHP
jgi:hypothetical protein